MKIMLVDDHDLFREGLKYLLPVLDSSLEFFEASDFDTAQHIAGNVDIDLILLDYYIPGVVGMDALRHFRDRFETAMLVVVSGEEDPKIIRSAIEHGASGYIPKSSSRENLEKALKYVLSGQTYLPDSYLQALEAEREFGASKHLSVSDGIHAQLSRRQYEVLMKVIQGKANKVIARELNISDQTVKAHLSQAFRTLGVNNRTEAVYVAAKLGMQPSHNP
ncbi:MAG: DNA-binding response regulator [marine bacterium B5-7]|nr:MAG: DNA-binding response regulator [marine bacterium B5-7]